MTVYAHIMTTRVVDEHDSFRMQASHNTDPEADLIDVWFVTTPDTLSGKDEQEIKDLLSIRDYGIWITSPYNNCFWVVKNLENDFSVREIASANFSNYYTKYEIEELLNNCNIDDALDAESINPVQNKVVTAELNNKLDINEFNQIILNELNE